MPRSGVERASQIGFDESRRLHRLVPSALAGERAGGARRQDPLAAGVLDEEIRGSKWRVGK
jgi:hypothetical protein